MARRRKKGNKDFIAIVIVIIALVYNFYAEEINNYIVSHAYIINSYNIGEIPDYTDELFVYINICHL